MLKNFGLQLKYSSLPYEIKTTGVNFFIEKLRENIEFWCSGCVAKVGRWGMD